MKKISLFSVILLFIFSAFISKQEKYTVVTSTSSIEWMGEKVTGSHEGTIQIKSGILTLSDGKLISGVLEMDMNTIEVTDIESEKMNEKLKQHLYSSDFFNVKEFPSSQLLITAVTKSEGNKHIIKGKLTIKGITEKVEIPATILYEADKIVAVGETKIDRTKFNIHYGSGSFFDNLGDKAIKNDFTIKFKVGAKK